MPIHLLKGWKLVIGFHLFFCNGYVVTKHCAYLYVLYLCVDTYFTLQIESLMSEKKIKSIFNS